MLHPITFSIAKEKIIENIPEKTKIISSLIPGQLHTYIYNTEEEYYKEYQQSFFATTIKKGGWDCLRHYEIMANGCIPFFPDIDQCPPNTLALLPKDLLYEGNNLYNKFIKKTIQDLTPEDLNEYTILVNKILEFVKSHLTSKHIADYILHTSQRLQSKRILFLSSQIEPDYLRCLTLHGFKELLGAECHDYPKIPHIYKTNTINYSSLYGKGITYTNLLEPALHNDTYDDQIYEMIQNRMYDTIIYGSHHRGKPLFDIVNQYYKPNEIILLCGEDIHECTYNNWVNKGYNVFVREL